MIILNMQRKKTTIPVTRQEYIHTKKMSKFKVGQTIRKKFKRLWHDGKISSIKKKNKLHHVKYNDNDSDMTMAEVRKHWVKKEPEDKNSSSKKNSGPRKITQFLGKFKINF